MWHRALGMARGGASALVLALAAAAASGTEPGPRVPSFAVGVDLVSLNLVVTDARGNPVPSLGPDDLTLLEDGVPQPISLFAKEEWPIRLQVLLDSSGSMGAALPVAKRAAVRLLRTLRSGDEAAVARFSRYLRVLQESTDDLALLEQSIASVAAGGETALYNALYVMLKDEARRPEADALHRRAIVVLTDGEDTASMVSDAQLIELARRSGVAVYAIGLLEPAGTGTPTSTLPSYVLSALARETGGRAYFPRSLAELDQCYDRIAADLRTLYGVGYVPLNTAADGRFRRIAIRARQPGLLVRHRTGYYAPGSAGDTLRLLTAASR